MYFYKIQAVGSQGGVFRPDLLFLALISKMFLKFLKLLALISKMSLYFTNKVITRVMLRYIFNLHSCGSHKESPGL